MSVRASLLFAIALMLLATAASVQAQPAYNVDQLVDRTKSAVIRGNVYEAKYIEVIAYGDKAIAPVVKKLLGEDNASFRIVGAMILARIAEKSRSPRLLKLLGQCWQDSSQGVNYWGLRGLLVFRNLSKARAESLVLESLSPKRPHPMRLVGCDAAGERKVVKAVPWLAAILKKQGPQYSKAKKTIFVEEVEDKNVEEDEEPKMRKRAIIPGESRASIVLKAAEKLEQHPAVTEVRCAGIAMEKLVKKAFGFMDKPPWDLGTSLMRAREWFEMNKARYPGGPEEEKKEATPEEPTPAREPAPAGGRRLPVSPSGTGGSGGRGGRGGRGGTRKP